MMTNLKIENVKTNPGSVDIIIKREIGAGDLSGVKIAVFDGANTQIFEKKTPINELEEKTFNLNYSGIIKEVSVSPILKLSSGKEKTGSQTGKIIFTNQEAVRNLGLVSWWRFEGNANDEMRINNGILNGGVDCNVQGKYGKACKFDGIDDYISVADSSSFVINKSISIIAWIKTPSTNDNSGIVDKYGETPPYTNFGYKLGTNGGPVFRTDFGNGSTYTGVTTGGNMEDNSWHQVISSYNGSAVKLYMDDGSPDINNNWVGFLTSNNLPLLIGRSYYSPSTRSFNGTIDEVMIFNRALTDEEIHSLYKLDLNS